METWVTVWKVVLYVGLGLFTALSLWVIVGGLSDIRAMFASLREDAEDAGEAPGDGTSAK
jgi:hypothetical protein